MRLLIKKDVSSDNKIRSFLNIDELINRRELLKE